jgi:hypothetical protein
MSRVSTDRGQAAHVEPTRSTLMAVRRVLHAYREGWLLEERLATVGRMIAADARQDGLSAAGMIVGLKRAWATLADVRDLAVHDGRALLERLVTQSIEAYYARPAARGDAMPRPTTQSAA